MCDKSWCRKQDHCKSESITETETISKRTLNIQHSTKSVISFGKHNTARDNPLQNMLCAYQYQFPETDEHGLELRIGIQRQTELGRNGYNIRTMPKHLCKTNRVTCIKDYRHS